MIKRRKKKVSTPGSIKKKRKKVIGSEPVKKRKKTLKEKIDKAVGKISKKKKVTEVKVSGRSGPVGYRVSKSHTSPDEIFPNEIRGQLFFQKLNKKQVSKVDLLLKRRAQVKAILYVKKQAGVPITNAIVAVNDYIRSNHATTFKSLLSAR